MPNIRNSDGSTTSGWLEKRRRVRGWVWKRYWFVLQADQLAYYKNPADSSTSRGLIDMNQAQCVRAGSAAVTKSCTFEIVTSSKTHILSADTAESRDQWVRLLQRSMYLRCRQSSIMERPSCDSISDVDDEYQSLSTDELSEGASSGGPGNDNVFESEPSQQPAHCGRASPQQQEWMRRASDQEKVKQPSPLRHTQSSRLSDRDSLDPAMRDIAEITSSVQQVNSQGHEQPVVMRRSQVPPTPVIVVKRASGPPTEAEIQNDQRTQEMCDSIRNITFTFPPIPPLPNPRLEMTWDSVFDQIRTFIARNRAPKEVYATPRRSQVQGRAMNELKTFLMELDADT